MHTHTHTHTHAHTHTHTHTQLAVTDKSKVEMEECVVGGAAGRYARGTVGLFCT